MTSMQHGWVPLARKGSIHDLPHALRLARHPFLSQVHADTQAAWAALEMERSVLCRALEENEAANPARGAHTGQPPDSRVAVSHLLVPHIFAAAPSVGIHKDHNDQGEGSRAKVPRIVDPAPECRSESGHQPGRTPQTRVSVPGQSQCT